MREDTCEDAPVCNGFFGDLKVSYPIGFDLRIIYLEAKAPAMSELLENTLKKLGIKFTMIQGIAAAPGKKYARMGARITVHSEEAMQSLYSEVAKLPGVVSVI
jgi:hypothetical protein